MNRNQPILLLGKDLSTTEQAWLRKFPLPSPKVIEGGHLPPGFDGVAEAELMALLRQQFELSTKHSLAELMQGRRAYATLGGFLQEIWRKVADYYDYYVPKLAGVVRKSLAQRVAKTMQQVESDLHTADEVGAALAGVLKGFSQGRLNTIVRTEGTRAAGLSRRHTALLAREAGWGPDYYVGSAILDDRTTETCKFWDGYRWSIEDSERGWNILHPPNHYNCRSLVRYGYKGDDDDIPEWTDERVQQWLAIQKAEFPKWENRLVYLPEEA